MTKITVNIISNISIYLFCCALINELNILRNRVEELETSESERMRMERALRESEAEKRAILDASIDRIRHVDENFRIIWANKTTLELDMSPEDVIGQTCYKVFAGKDTPCEGCPNLKSRQTGQIERAVIHKPWVNGIDGETFWDLYIVPLKNKSGKIQTYFQIARSSAEDNYFAGSLDDIHIYHSALTEDQIERLAFFRADINRDGFVDLFDFSALAKNWLQTCSGSEWCDGSDINWSGMVDANDLNVLASIV